jgi:hypothetical protein
MTNTNLAHGDELCRVIERIADVEWRKFQARTINVVLKNGITLHQDNSKIPPFTSIRFSVDNPELVARLKLAVDSYEGVIAWQMVGHQRISLPGTNWVTRPVFVEKTRAEIAEGSDVGRYIADHYPDFAPIAYSDLLGLAEHVRKFAGG